MLMNMCIDPRIDRLRPLETRDALGFCSAPGGALCQAGRPGRPAAYAGVAHLIAFTTWRAERVCYGLVVVLTKACLASLSDCVSPESPRFASEPTLLYTPASEGHLIKPCKLPEVI